MPMSQQDNTAFSTSVRVVLAVRKQPSQIDRVSPISGAPRAPYALEPTSFPFPALATQAGRASMGGPREIALACMLVGRLVIDAKAGSHGLTGDQRRARAQGARSWLGSATIPVPVRAALVKLADATVAADKPQLKTAMDSVMTITANHLDSGARLEFARLSQAIAE